MAARFLACLTLTAALMACAPLPEQPRYSYAQPDCYHTLARVDCHDTALAGEASRRVGHYQAPVEVSSWPR